MTSPARLLDVLAEIAEDGPFSSILATTFTFDSEFFVSTGVLPALAGELDRSTATGVERRRRVDTEVVRDRLGNPYVGVLQGCPSASGATPGWVERYLWPTRRLGVLHAKCLVAVGSTNAHVVVASANLTEGSWCRNLEVAACWSTPLAPKSPPERRRAQALGEIAGGIAKLAELTKAPSMVAEAQSLRDKLTHPVNPLPVVVWSGGPFENRPLEQFQSGDELVVTSPFWAADEASATRVVAALRNHAPTVTAVGRSPLGGRVMEFPDAFESAARAARVELAVAQPPGENGNAGLHLAFRQLHAKQISTRTGGSWRSYVGSANATVQGLALSSRSNIELGVIVDTGPLLPWESATGTQAPPGLADLDDPSGLLDGVAGWADLYARAFLKTDGMLRVHVEPAPKGGTVLEIPTGGPTRELTRRVDQDLWLADPEIASLVSRAEITVVTPTVGRLAVPVVLDDTLKGQVGGLDTPSSSDVDELLSQLARNPIRRPSDDDANTADTHDIDQPEGPVPPAAAGPPRKPVHRAREAIEVITAADQPLGAFLAGYPPARLVELRIGGAGSVVDLARRVASTAGTEQGLTVVAAAFVVNEIALLLNRLRKNHGAKAVLDQLAGEVKALTDHLIGQVETGDAVAARRLRRIGGPR